MNDQVDFFWNLIIFVHKVRSVLVVLSEKRKKVEYIFVYGASERWEDVQRMCFFLIFWKNFSDFNGSSL